MGIRFLTPAAVACLLLNTTVALAPAAAQTAKQHVALASDSNFIQTAMSIGLLQVKLGKLAQEQGSSEVVRDFGKRMVADYTRTNEQLAAFCGRLERFFAFAQQELGAVPATFSEFRRAYVAPSVL